MMFNNPEETYSLNEKFVVAAVLLLPVALAVVAMIGENRRLSEVEAMKNRPVRYYEYAIRPVDTVLNHPVGLRGRSLIEDDGRGNGVVLNSGGNKIVTGLSSEEILEQLDLDYQDVYDYYGGAEELR
ncbi:unknown [Alistipes sp. CAG:435]|nr:unknown [Alistipes sp. CAG:435]